MIEISKNTEESENIIVPNNVLNVKEMNQKEVLHKINIMFTNHFNQIDNNEEQFLEIPLKRRENIIYNEHGNLFLGQLTEKISLNDSHDGYLMILKAAEDIKMILEKSVHVTKREIYYNDPILYKDQRNSDRAIENLASYLGTRRKCLNVVASAKGSCIGRVKLNDCGDEIDLQKIGTGGWYITPMLEKIGILESDADFILVLEKDAPFIRLAEAKIWKKIPCIMLTGKGMPDIATREFLKLMVKELKIPVYGLFDSDPYGIDIMFTYSLGSIALARETPWLAVNDFSWLGIIPEEVEKFEEKMVYTASEMDLKKAEHLLSLPHVQMRPKIKTQLEKFLEIKKKAEIQAVANFGFENLMKYITEKIPSGNFIKI